MIKAIVGEVFAQIGAFFVELTKALIEESFVFALIGGMICLLLIVGGSKRARKWLYWDIFGFGIIQLLKAAFGL